MSLFVSLLLLLIITINEAKNMTFWTYVKVLVALHPALVPRFFVRQIDFHTRSKMSRRHRAGTPEISLEQSVYKARRWKKKRIGDVTICMSRHIRAEQNKTASANRALACVYQRAKMLVLQANS